MDRKSLECEREEWIKMAEACTQLYKLQNVRDELAMGIGLVRCLGLCALIDMTDVTASTHESRTEIRKRMQEKVDKFGDDHSLRFRNPRYQGALSRYYWPVTAEGHEQRRQFCLEQARLIDELLAQLKPAVPPE